MWLREDLFEEMNDKAGKAMEVIFLFLQRSSLCVLAGKLFAQHPMEHSHEVLHTLVLGAIKYLLQELLSMMMPGRRKIYCFMGNVCQKAWAQMAISIISFYLHEGQKAVLRCLSKTIYQPRHRTPFLCPAAIAAMMAEKKGVTRDLNIRSAQCVVFQLKSF
ncbi:hypothetical protein EMCRGX_G008534 [Ephydatia muelleri]